MFEDNQFFASVQHQMAQNNSLRVTAGLLGVPDQYELLKAQPAGKSRLPMTAGQPDFVFSDEDDGVMAIKNGGEIVYVSLYWRARNAINFLARVHYITPRFDRIAMVHEEVEFEAEWNDLHAAGLGEFRFWQRRSDVSGGNAFRGSG